MDLFFRKYGSGPALIIVHGLYGSGDNWISIAKELAPWFEVYNIDQRNHGNSPHSKEHNYLLLKNDLNFFMQKHGIDSAVLLGHSMGGKTVMHFSADFPQKVKAMIVVDISPRSYGDESENAPQSINHMNIINAMMAIDLEKANSRTDIDKMLSGSIHSKRVRTFLLKNIKRKDQDHFEWKINLETLKNSLPDIMDGLNPEKFRKRGGITSFPSLFIKGANSEYISDADYPVIKDIYPDAQIVSIGNAGHWVHAEQPELLVKNIRYFLNV